MIMLGRDHHVVCIMCHSFFSQASPWNYIMKGSRNLPMPPGRGPVDAMTRVALSAVLWVNFTDTCALAADPIAASLLEDRLLPPESLSLIPIAIPTINKQT